MWNGIVLLLVRQVYNKSDMATVKDNKRQVYNKFDMATVKSIITQHGYGKG